MPEQGWPTFQGDESLRRRHRSKGAKNKQEREEKGKRLRGRFSQRHAEWGRMMERRMSKILEGMVERGVLASFTYHEPHSPEDSDGKDFTVRKDIGGKVEERSVGITISQGSLFRSQAKHADVVQWHLPINTNDGTIESKVLSLF